MFEAVKCLSLGAEVAERSCFSQFSLARMVSPGGKAATSQFIPFPKTQQLAGELAAPLSHLYPTWCSGVLGWGCISHCALCRVQPKNGKSQEKDVVVPVPRGCREGSSAATSQPGALLLHFLPTPPSTVASRPTFLILLVPALISLIPCWVPFKAHCNPDIGSVLSTGQQPGCGMGAALQGTTAALGTSAQPSHPRWTPGWARGVWGRAVSGMRGATGR